MNENHKKGIIFATISIILMSIESPFVKLANLYWADTSFLLGIGLIISINAILASKGKRYFIQSYKTQFVGVLLSGLSVGLGNLTFVSAVIYGGVANTVLILATSPIFSALAMWILFKKQTPKTIFIATFFIMVGLYIILQNDLGTTTFLGTFLAFLCVGFMISTFIVLSHFKNASKFAFISIAGFCLSGFSFPFASLHVNLESALCILFLGLLTMPISRFFLGLGAKNILPQELSLLMILESVLAPLWAWWWIGEKPLISTFIGGGIILATLALYILSSTKKGK